MASGDRALHIKLNFLCCLVKICSFLQTLQKLMLFLLLWKINTFFSYNEFLKSVWFAVHTISNAKNTFLKRKDTVKNIGVAGVFGLVTNRSLRPIWCQYY